jgi:hypothetical protein
VGTVTVARNVRSGSKAVASMRSSPPTKKRTDRAVGPRDRGRRPFRTTCRLRGIRRYLEDAAVCDARAARTANRRGGGRPLGAGRWSSYPLGQTGKAGSLSWATHRRRLLARLRRPTISADIPPRVDAPRGAVRRGSARRIARAKAEAGGTASCRGSDADAGSDGPVQIRLASRRFGSCTEGRRLPHRSECPDRHADPDVGKCLPAAVSDAETSQYDAKPIRMSVLQRKPRNVVRVAQSQRVPGAGHRMRCRGRSGMVGAKAASM